MMDILILFVIASECSWPISADSLLCFRSFSHRGQNQVVWHLTLICRLWKHPRSREEMWTLDRIFHSPLCLWFGEKSRRLKKSRNSNASCYRYVYNTARLRHQELLIPPVGHCLLVFVGRMQHKVDGARQTWWCSGPSPPLPWVIEGRPPGLAGRPREPWVPQVQRGDVWFKNRHHASGPEQSSDATHMLSVWTQLSWLP